MDKGKTGAKKRVRNRPAEKKRESWSFKWVSA